MAKTTRSKTEVKDDVTDTGDMPPPVIMSEPVPMPEPDAKVDTQTADTEEPPEPVVDAPKDAPPIPPAKEPKSGSGFGGMVVGGVIAAALGYGVATYAPIPGLSGTSAQTEQSENALALLGDRVAALESAPAPVAAPDDALAVRVAALESAPSPSVPDLAPLNQSIDDIDARLTTLETAQPAESGAVIPDYSDEIAALRAEVQDLKGSGESVSAEIAAAAADANARLADAEAQATKLKAEAEETARKALARAALGRLQASLESGVPFVSALGNLSGLEVPPFLAEVAETGVPTQSGLESAFPPAARTALDASRKVDVGASAWERAGTFLQSTTGARSLAPRAGTDPDAILSRAEAALKSGDLEKTMTEISALPAEGQAAMAGFTTLVNQRYQAIKEVKILSNAIEE